MEIFNHKLAGDLVTFEQSPNRGGVITPQYLVIHYTAGSGLEGTVRHFLDPNAKASAHLAIGRDGNICQMVPFNLKAWHAGVSTWAGLQGLNTCSIGIELDNAGRLTPVGSEFQAWFGKRYPTSEAIRARHKNETTETWWHAYTEKQITAARQVAALLMTTYGLKEILGHDDIAPGRKVDPGPAFPMSSFKSTIIGRDIDAAPTWIVSAPLLNIRKGPGPEFELLRQPLPKGALLTQLDTTANWLKVVVEDNTRIEGWVNINYIEPVKG